MKSFFQNLFGNKDEPPKKGRPRTELDFFKRGDVIGGEYEVHDILGKGGFGVVYLVRVRATGEVLALKTFRDEFLTDAIAREAFKKEVLLWMKLGDHPFILAARWVREISNRPFVAMDYIAADAEGRASLADFLSAYRLEANRVLLWAMQFCVGMEHACANGIRCHRDIKPPNILISRDGTLKISDFGLAAAAEIAWIKSSGHHGTFAEIDGKNGPGFSLMKSGSKAVCGTPGYMPPEVCRGEGADLRSDIYSFGVVLWQMAAGSPALPFKAQWRGNLEMYAREIYEQQIARRVPCVEGVLWPIIERCLQPKPLERYQSFEELRGALQPIYERTTGRKFAFPPVCFAATDFSFNDSGSLVAVGEPLNAFQIVEQSFNSISSLIALGQHEEALNLCDNALTLKPQDADVWTLKGLCLAALGRGREAMPCYDRALSIDPRNESAWHNKGKFFNEIGQPDNAVRCYDRALAINPQKPSNSLGKGNGLLALGRHREAMDCYDKAIALDPRQMNVWNSKAALLAEMGRLKDAIACCDKALTIDPLNSLVWYNRARLLDDSKDWPGAIASYRKFLELAPANDKEYVADARERLRELTTGRV